MRKRAAGEREPSRLGSGQRKIRGAPASAPLARGDRGGREPSWGDLDDGGTSEGVPRPEKRRRRGGQWWGPRGSSSGGEGDAAHQHPARLLERDAARR